MTCSHQVVGALIPAGRGFPGMRAIPLAGNSRKGDLAVKGEGK